MYIIQLSRELSCVFIIFLSVNVYLIIVPSYRFVNIYYYFYFFIIFLWILQLPFIEQLQISTKKGVLPLLFSCCSD